MVPPPRTSALADFVLRAGERRSWRKDVEKSTLLSCKNCLVPIPKGFIVIVINLENPDRPKEKNQNGWEPAHRGDRSVTLTPGLHLMAPKSCQFQLQTLPTLPIPFHLVLCPCPGPAPILSHRPHLSSSCLAPFSVLP